MTQNVLNHDQRKAVESDARSLLITAGPGSGKTHTLIHRVIRKISLLQPGRRVLAITFTRKAADEMRSRMLACVDSFEDRVFIGTFHQCCRMLLRDYGGYEGSVASDQRCLEIAASLWPDVSSREWKKRLEQISREKAVERVVSSAGYSGEFNSALRLKQCYDFDDLILEAAALLRDRPETRDHVQSVYADICVDEYQDMNPAQNDLLKLLAGPRNTLTVIGDPDQAIYGFRGARMEIFHGFSRDFEGAETVCLRENYRNSPGVLAASSQVMGKGSLEESTVEQIAGIDAQGKLTVHESVTDRAEAEYVVHTIEKLVGGTSMFSRDSGRVDHDEGYGFTFGDIAVFYRLKSQVRELKRAFERSGMPFFISGDISAEVPRDIEEDLFDQREAEQEMRTEKVSLMTLHASKGLEFPCVFICGCEDGLLPLRLLQMTGDEEEERRLFYVGMTRAKHALYLTHARKRMLYGTTYRNQISPFIGGIQDSLKRASRSEYRRKAEPRDDGQMSLF